VIALSLNHHYLQLNKEKVRCYRNQKRNRYTLQDKYAILTYKFHQEMDLIITTNCHRPEKLWERPVNRDSKERVCMMKKQKKGLLQTKKELNTGAIVSGIGFLLYIAASALEWIGAANVIAIAFALVSLWVFLSAVTARGKDKETASGNLIVGTGALTLLLAACAVLAIRRWMGM